MEDRKDSICIKPAETDEELCGRGYVHCVSWQKAYRGIVCDRYLDSMTVEATTARAIYVLPEYYGHKIGYRLMNEAFSRLGEYNTVFLWVLEKNERAIRFYHKYGFEFDGCKKQWNLGTPVSIARMVKKRK